MDCTDYWRPYTKSIYIGQLFNQARHCHFQSHRLCFLRTEQSNVSLRHTRMSGQGLNKVKKRQGSWEKQKHDCSRLEDDHYGHWGISYKKEWTTLLPLVSIGLQGIWYTVKAGQKLTKGHSRSGYKVGPPHPPPRPLTPPGQIDPGILCCVSLLQFTAIAQLLCYCNQHNRSIQH